MDDPSSAPGPRPSPGPNPAGWAPRERTRVRVADAELAIRARVRRGAEESVPLGQALGRVLAAPLRARAAVPLFPRSAMDGYAVRAADLPGRLRVTQELMAADRSLRTLGPGEAARVMTGAAIVPGADTVVMVEDSRADGEVIRVDQAQEPGRHVIATGEDVAEGAQVLTAGRRLRPQDVALAALLGFTELRVVRRPRVRVIPTGSELVSLGRARGATAPNEVIESNSWMLAALGVRDGAEVSVGGLVRDDEAQLARALDRADADLIVVTGGSSVGKQDLGPLVLGAGGELWFHGLHARPASPSGMGRWGVGPDGPVVLLAPGFPVACYVAWDLVGRVAVQAWLGESTPWPYAHQAARFRGRYAKPAERLDLVRVRLEAEPDGGLAARGVPGGAAILSTLTRADGFVVVPEGTSGLEDGQPVDVRVY